MDHEAKHDGEEAEPKPDAPMRQGHAPSPCPPGETKGRPEAARRPAWTAEGARTPSQAGHFSKPTGSRALYKKPSLHKKPRAHYGDEARGTIG